MNAVVLGFLLLESAVFAGIPQTGAGEKLTIVNGYVFVDVTIGGQGPFRRGPLRQRSFRMLLDSGASSCSLRPELARAAGLTADHRVLLATMTGERPVPAASSAHISVGPVEAGGAEILILDPEGVRGVDVRVDGVLGQSFLSRFPYLIDYRRKLLWLGDEARRQASRLTTEIVTKRVDGRMVLPVGIETEADVSRPGPSRLGLPALGLWRLTLDTGSNSLVVRCGARCPPLRNAREGDRIVTNSGSCAVRRGMVHRVTVGTVTIPRAEAALLDGPESGFEDGVLPANWFSAVYVDSSRSIVRLAK